MIAIVSIAGTGVAGGPRPAAGVGRPHRRRFLHAGVAVFLLLAGCGRQPATTSGAPSGAPQGTQIVGVTDRSHVQGPVRYDRHPPAGGQHASVWLNCGIYDQPVQDENAVHSLEHGAIWITYLPGLPEAQVETLRQVVRARWIPPQGYLILSPYHPGQSARVAITGWGNQLFLDNADDPRLAEFIQYFRGVPSAPEPGAPCQGGTGRPKP